MATNRDDEVYATLLLSDTYLPGALVLAHSLLDNGTTKKLAVLVTEDTVSPEAIAQLETVYHHVIPVPLIRNAHPNLELMNRVDLHSAYTKINLWNLTQFSKIVYIDADIVAYRAPDELFKIDAPFSAAPDIGWPDIFNTGVMVLKPDPTEYEQLRAKAEDGESFDGADQGLLNMHFGTNFNRISFTYNVTPSAHYQYIPAYKHFQSSINMVHFIGAQKPWFQGRPDGTSNINESPEASPHEKMIHTWWNIYDKHYGQSEKGEKQSASHEDAKLVQYLVKGEFDPFAGTTQEDSGQKWQQQQEAVPQDYLQEPVHPSPQVAAESYTPSSSFHHQEEHRDDGQPAPHRVEWAEPSRTPPPMEPVWDGSRQPPPTFSKPEAPGFPDTKYEMSRDSAPFVPPERYPSPPRDMWYSVPTERHEPSQKPNPIFPWEDHRPAPTRVFAPDYVTPALRKPEVRIVPVKGEASPPRPGGEPEEPSSPASSTRSVRFRDENEEIVIPSAGSPLLEADDKEISPSETAISPPSPEPVEEIDAPQIPPSEFWSSSAAANAWDDVPGIRRYIERVIDQTGLGGRRRRDILGQRTSYDGKGPIHMDEGAPPTRQPRRGFFKITDFPSAFDNPSLPVTPALPTTPRDRWLDVRYGEGEDEEGEMMSPPPPPGPLLAAEGVPRQSEWVCVHGHVWGPYDCLCDLTNVLRYHKNPVERLAKLASDPEALLRRLSVEKEGVPERKIVESSEGLPGGSHREAVGDGKEDIGRSDVSRRTSKPKDTAGTRIHDGKNTEISQDERGEASGQQKSAEPRVSAPGGEAEIPLVAPVPVKGMPSDPVEELEAASSQSGPGKATEEEDGSMRDETAGRRESKGPWPTKVNEHADADVEDTEPGASALTEDEVPEPVKEARQREAKGVGEGDVLRSSRSVGRVLDI